MNFVFNQILEKYLILKKNNEIFNTLALLQEVILAPFIIREKSATNGSKCTFFSLLDDLIICTMSFEMRN
jgi:hypothetical protein